jgi:hypothetical protein
MPETIAPELVDPNGQVLTSRRRTATALVWADDDDQSGKAVKHVRYALWPFWFLFEVTEVQLLPVGGSCPLTARAPSSLASTRRDRWMWVLVPPERPPHEGDEVWVRSRSNSASTGREKEAGSAATAAAR